MNKRQLRLSLVSLDGQRLEGALRSLQLRQGMVFRDVALDRTAVDYAEILRMSIVVKFIFTDYSLSTRDAVIYGFADRRKEPFAQ